MAEVGDTVESKKEVVEKAMTPKTEVEQEDSVWKKLMEQNLEGLMFHSYSVDLFDLLSLKGFKKMHEHQVKEESESLDKIKHKYIKEYQKLPIITTNTDYWSKAKHLRSNEMSHEDISTEVKELMEAWASWESEVLEHLMRWKRNAEDKKLVHCMIEDVMKEIKYIETIINVLEEHD